MKRLITIALCLTMCLCLAACASSNCDSQQESEIDITEEPTITDNYWFRASETIPCKIIAQFPQVSDYKMSSFNGQVGKFQQGENLVGMCDVRPMQEVNCHALGSLITLSVESMHDVKTYSRDQRYSAVVDFGCENAVFVIYDADREFIESMVPFLDFSCTCQDNLH